MDSAERAVQDGINAECDVLASGLLDNSVCELFASLSVDHFSTTDHRRIFRAELRLHEQGPFDYLLIVEELKRTGGCDARLMAYIASLPDRLPLPQCVPQKIEILQDNYLRRRFVSAGELFKSLGADPSIPGDELIARMRDVVDGLGCDGVRRLRVVSSREFLEMQLPPRECLLTPIIPAQGLVMLFAPRGRGKTYVSIGCGIAVASGGRFARWIAPKPAGVLYVDGEMPAAVLQGRLAAMAAGADDFNPELLRFVTPDLQGGPLPDLATRSGQAFIEREIGEARLLIIDNLSALVRSGVENEAESWLPIQDWGLRLRQRGISVLFVHHAGKNGLQRGTSRREDLLDCVIALKSPKDYSPEQGLRAEVHYEKARGFFGAEAMPFELQMTEAADRSLCWTVSDLAESKRLQAVELHDEGIPLSQIAKTLGISKTSAHRLVNS